MGNNNNSKSVIVPFELISLPSAPTENATKEISIKPFIQKVLRALENDLQDDKSFGCKIKTCHTHAGSKIHFDSFVEAELLFHNSYYNERFAALTVNYISNIMAELSEEEKTKIKNILLIGYEKYSELFLTTLREKVKDRVKSKLACEYCVYETNAVVYDGERHEVSEIRRLKLEENKDLKVESEDVAGSNNDGFLTFRVDETLFLFIVPINTSLSTMDKMVAKFNEILGCTKKEDIITKWKDCFKNYLCLITLYSNKEFFGFVDGNGKTIDVPEERIEFFINELNGDDYYLSTGNNRNGKKFEHIDDSKIKNFVICKADSWNATNCGCCFPKNGNLSEETPMFGVNRSSVVPMLKFGHYTESKPVKELTSDNNVVTNFKRVWELSKYMEYRHIVRSDNHFQFYFHTEKYLENELSSVGLNDKSEIINWLISIGSSYKKKSTVFDYLVAPRHSTNAKFVYLVKNFVFGGKARIIFFDADREYRSNLSAKYSDLISALSNIKSSNLDYEIRFHFVDDMINSGATFSSAKNLISSIIAEAVGENIQDKISLFYDGILLINRMSEKRQNYYIPVNGDYNNFHYYVNVNISSMRNHEDACTLCKLGYDYKKVREQCATNALADICSEIIYGHKPEQYVQGEGKSSDNKKAKNENKYKSAQSILEKRYLFFISHLLNYRIANKFCLSEEEQHFIESERTSSGLTNLLRKYYDYNSIKKYIANLDESGSGFKICDVSFIWEIAFIKAISRPFFTYHIRSCQAAFAFCLDRLNYIISDENVTATDKIKNSMRIQTLVKALADMNSNYIIRKQILDNLFKWADTYDELINFDDESLCNEEKNYIIKRLFKPESLLHYIKKDLVLSRDTTKSLLLEHIILKQSESGFFGSKIEDNNQTYIENFNEDKDFKLENDMSQKIPAISLQGKLYLENNLILRSTLQKDIDKLLDDNINADSLYFFENFSKVWRLNTGTNLVNDTAIFNQYKEVVGCLSSFNIMENRNEISNSVNKLLKLVDGEIRAFAFLHDTNENNELFQFFALQENLFDDMDNNKLGESYKFPELLTSQAFFHEENLENIRKVIDDKEDLIFISDVLHNGISQALIVRFRSDKGINEENDVNIDNKLDDSIYFQLWGFEKSKPKHWFALKLLLTLRNNFVNFIKNIKLQELIEERKVATQKEALAINKAATHSQSENFFMEDIISSEIESDGSRDPNRQRAKKIISYIPEDKQAEYERDIEDAFTDIKNLTQPSEREIYSAISKIPIDCEEKFILFDRYFQLLSNEIISSVYRRVIRKEDIAVGKGKTHYVLTLCRLFDFKKKDKQIKVNFYLKIKQELKTVKVNFRFNREPELMCVPNINFIEGGIDGWVFINLIMVANFAEHCDAKNNMIVSISENSVEFKNDTAACDTKYEKYEHIPPWLFRKEDQHITLWTFKHAFNSVDKRGLQCNIKVDNNDFIVTFSFN